jgi:hypothetical protein
LSHLDINISPRHAPTVPQVTNAMFTAPQPKRGAASKVDAFNAEMHITCQFRQGRAMVYDLKAGQRRFEMRIQASTTASGAWDVAMLVKEAVEKPSVDAMGATRLLALDALENGSGDMLAREEWVGIRKALTAVRAL